MQKHTPIIIIIYVFTNKLLSPINNQKYLKWKLIAINLSQWISHVWLSSILVRNFNGQLILILFGYNKLFLFGVLKYILNYIMRAGN